MKNLVIIAISFFCLGATAQEESTEVISQRYDLTGLTIEGKKKLKPHDKIVLNNLNFKPGTAEFLSESEPALEDLLKIMRDNPKLKIQVNGHICCLPDKWNEISEQRARAVWLFLLLNEVENERVTYKDYGGTQPIYPMPERNEIERRQNRRVEIVVISN